jgi:hypothetical protein
MNITETEIIKEVLQGLSDKIYQKASKSFLRKNLLLPIRIKDGCLYVATRVDSHLAAMDDLKSVYSCKSVTGFEIDKESFDRIFRLCFDPEVKQEKIEDKKKPTDQKTIKLKLNNKLVGLCSIGFVLLCVIIFLSSDSTHKIKGQISSQYGGIAVGGNNPYLTAQLTHIEVEILPDQNTRYSGRYKIISTAIIKYEILDVEKFNKYQKYRSPSFVKFKAITKSGVELKSATGKITFVGGDTTTTKTSVSGEIRGLTSNELKRTSFVCAEWDYNHE